MPTLWAAADLLLEVVVSRQRVRDAPNPRGWVERPPSPCTPQDGDAVEHLEKGSGHGGKLRQGRGASRIWQVIWNASES